MAWYIVLLETNLGQSLLKLYVVGMELPTTPEVT